MSARVALYVADIGQRILGGDIGWRYWAKSAVVATLNRSWYAQDLRADSICRVRSAHPTYSQEMLACRLESYIGLAVKS